MVKAADKKTNSKMKVPRIYLDTAIIRNLIEKKPACLVNLMSTIKERKWICFSSTLGILELADLKKDDVYLHKKVNERAEYKEIIRSRDRKKLSDDELTNVKSYIDSFLKKYPFFSPNQIPIQAWQDAFAISLTSNIQSKDAVHLAAALIFGANVLLTYDEHFISEANKLLEKHNLHNRLKLIEPEKIYDTLSELGFSLEKNG